MSAAWRLRAKIHKMATMHQRIRHIQAVRPSQQFTCIWRLVWGGALWLSAGIALLSAAQVAIGLGRARGPFGSPNYLGYYAVCHVFLALAWRNKAAIPIAIANAMVVVASQSRASLVALAIGSGILIPWRTWSILPILALALSVGAILLIPHGPELSRAWLWRVALELISRRPWFGYGRSDGFIMGLRGFYSVPLDWTVRTGLVGLAAGLALYAQAMRLASRRMRAFLIAWGVNGIFIFTTPESTLPFLGAVLWLGCGGGLDIPQAAVGQHDADRGRADAYARAERYLAHLADRGERDVIGELLGEQAPKLGDVLRTREQRHP